jgi:hypothetical protein
MSAPAKELSSARLSAMSDAELLACRLSDLRLEIEDSDLGALRDQLHRDLEARGLSFRPTCYLSTEWFVEQGETAIAMPFWLAHPRLVRLERKMILDVEGGTADEAMRILRHEAGHATDYAYGLGRTKDRGRLFGRSSAPYPEYYTPRPHSRSFVRHLDNWYAQSHPDEDFAETFAVLLTPADWRARYKSWKGALKKLEWMEALLRRLQSREPARKESFAHSIALDTRTLGEFYNARLQELADETSPEYVDGDLHRIFSPRARQRDAEAAADFIRRHRKKLRDTIAHWSGLKKYNVDRMLSAMIATSRELELVRIAAEDWALMELSAAGVALSKNYLFAGRFSMSS